MFGFLKSKRSNPHLIAEAILRIAGDNKIFGECIEQFGFSKEQIPRASFSMVVFLYWTAFRVAASKGEIKLVEACAIASTLIAEGLENHDNFVRIGDYVASDLELASLSMVLEERFKQRIPLPDYTNLAAYEAGYNAAVMSYEVTFGTLFEAMFMVRFEKYGKLLENCHEAKSNEPLVRYMVLARAFFLQVTGLPSVEAVTNNDLSFKIELSAAQGSLVLWKYSDQIFEALRDL